MFAKCQKLSINHSHLMLHAVLVLASLSLFGLRKDLITVGADDAPALDMNALASIASTIGSNPQIMSMMSSFLSQNGQKSVSSQTSPTQPELVPEQEPNLMAQPETNQFQAQVANEPLKRGMRFGEQPKSLGVVASNVQASSAIPASMPGLANANASSLSSLISLLPSVMSNLNIAGLNNVDNQNKQAVSPRTGQEQSISAVQTSSTTQTITSPSQNPPTSPATNSPAQSVINQVLVAYASGQIPNELIQLGLSGKVPPQIIELALSGQVPPQIIQMVITGQIPISTINAFLSSMQNNDSRTPRISSVSSRPESPASPSPAPSSNFSGLSLSSTTRALFEALFSRNRRDGQHSLTVPTLMGQVPIQIPSARRIGQMVGGTITNVASMIPF